MQTNVQKTNLAQTKDEELLRLRELVCALQKTNKDQSETIAQLKGTPKNKRIPLYLELGRPQVAPEGRSAFSRG
jgi:hypothetical protein